MIEWIVETRRLKDLNPHPKNPRKLSKHDAEHLQKSLERFGLIDKPVINTDNRIIGGHQRIAILKKMGIQECEVYVPKTSLDSKEVDELCLRLNRNLGEWDFDILANEYEVGDLLECGFTLQEFSIHSIENGGCEETSKKEKNKKVCPKCGHEF